MKKLLLISLILMFWITGYTQKWSVVTSDPTVPFKRHFSYSIEKGYENGVSRQVIAGNQTDWLVNSKVIKGNSNLFLSGKAVQMVNPDDNILMTDFAIAPDNGDSQYAAGTGIYFPNGPTGVGYVFLGIYERGTGTLTNLVYFDLLYPGVLEANTIGSRIKYSDHENAYYISGVMFDRLLVGIDFDNLNCHTKGFILKVSAPYAVANVIVIDPDQLAPDQGWLCSVNDIQIDAAQDAIAFTGVTTKADFTGPYQPMIGKIDMNLNIIWCWAYQLTDYRYSGIDVEFGQNDQSVFALFNSESRPFAITQVDFTSGNVLQIPIEYTFDMPLCTSPGTPPLPAIARGHIMHLTESNALIVTGNTYVDSDAGDQYQSLFKYDIPDANNLSSGLPTVGHYSCDIVPIGNQSGITSWWAPENSVYMDYNTYMVGSYTDNMITPPVYGYNFVNVNGFNTQDQMCYIPGNVTQDHMYAPMLKQCTYMTHTQAYNIPFAVYDWLPEPVQSCPTHHDKSVSANDNITDSAIWKYLGIDAGGIHAMLITDKQRHYQVSVFNITGKTVFSSGYDVDDLKTIYMNFSPNDELYFIRISNGIKVETLKVPHIR